MTTVSYNRFQGSVEFEKGRLLIQVLHIDDTVIGECDKASEVQSCFEELVDDYIETCELVGKDPCKPFKGVFNVRVHPQTHKQASMAASQQGVSLNAFVESALEQRIASEQFAQSLFRHLQTQKRTPSDLSDIPIQEFNRPMIQYDNENSDQPDQGRRLIFRGTRQSIQRTTQ